MAFRKPTSFALGFLWASSILHQALCACYNPDGTITKMTDMISCPRSDTFQLDTLCCGLGRENPYGGEKSIGATRDDCLPNGLCENAWVDKGVPKRSWWRGFCTDKNWNNETCLAVCTTGAVVEKYGNTQVTPCDGTRTSEKWCCGETTDCCTPDNNPAAIILAQTFGAPRSTTSSSSTTSATTASTATSSSTGIPTSSAVSVPSASTTANANADSKGLSTETKAGIGVGAAAGALTLIGLGFFLAHLRRRRKPENPPNHIVEAPGPYYETDAKQHPNVWQQTAHPAELESTPVRQELPVKDGPRRELSDTSI